MKITINNNPADMEIIMTMKFSEHELFMKDPACLYKLIVKEAGQLLAEHIVQNNMKDIMEHVSVQAIANMTMAEAGAAVNETLHKKLPDKILEIERMTVKPVVIQKGLFGRTRVIG